MVPAVSPDYVPMQTQNMLAKLELAYAETMEIARLTRKCKNVVLRIRNVMSDQNKFEQKLFVNPCYTVSLCSFRQIVE